MMGCGGLGEIKGKTCPGCDECEIDGGEEIGWEDYLTLDSKRRQRWRITEDGEDDSDMVHADIEFREDDFDIDGEDDEDSGF